MIKFLDGIAEKTAYLIAQILVKAKIKPIYVTLFRFITAAPLSFYFFSRGEYLFNVIGLLVYMAIAILDWTDGHMAQLYKLPKETAPLGRLIDHTSDRVLMMIVLASMFFGGLQTGQMFAWSFLAISYFSIFFFLTVSLYEFDRTFAIVFDQYPEIEEKMYKINKNPGMADKLIYNFLNVHNNSITRICFTHNYMLIIGVITNTLFLSLAFLALMHFVRSIGLFYITYKTFQVGPSNSALVKILREYKEKNEKGQKITM